MAAKKSLADQFREDPEDRVIYLQESLVVDVAQKIYEAMEQQNISSKELATKLDVNPSRISQYLSGDSNLTLKTVATIFEALDMEMTVDFRPINKEAETTANIAFSPAHLTFQQGATVVRVLPSPITSRLWSFDHFRGAAGIVSGQVGIPQNSLEPLKLDLTDVTIEVSEDESGWACSPF